MKNLQTMNFGAQQPQIQFPSQELPHATVAAKNKNKNKYFYVFVKQQMYTIYKENTVVYLLKKGAT